MTLFILWIILIDPTGVQQPPVMYPPVSRAECEALKAAELDNLGRYKLVRAKCVPVVTP